jgi:hypothetical protein
MLPESIVVGVGSVGCKPHEGLEPEAQLFPWSLCYRLAGGPRPHQVISCNGCFKRRHQTGHGTASSGDRHGRQVRLSIEAVWRRGAGKGKGLGWVAVGGAVRFDVTTRAALLCYDRLSKFG